MSKTFVKRFALPPGKTWQETAAIGKKWLNNHSMTPWQMVHTDNYVEFRGTYNYVPATSKQGMCEWK